MMRQIFEYIPIVLFFLIILLYFYCQPRKREFDISRESEQVVKRRFAKRNEYPVDQLLNDCCIANELKNQSIFIINGLNKILSVESNKLKREDVLIEFLSVNKNELDRSFDIKWEKADLGESVEVFDYDIFEFIEENCSSSAWNEKMKSLDQHPQNEGEWIEFMMSKNICELLSFFSPMIDL